MLPLREQKPGADHPNTTSLMGTICISLHKNLCEFLFSLFHIIDSFLRDDHHQSINHPHPSERIYFCYEIFSVSCFLWVALLYPEKKIPRSFYPRLTHIYRDVIFEYISILY